MRTLLTTLVYTLTLLAGVIGGSSIVYAAGCPAGQFADTATVCWPTQTAADVASASYASSNELTPGQQAAANTPTTYSADSQDSVMNGIMSKIATLFAWLVGVAALTLDYAVYYTVINMGSYVSNLTAIGVTWRILRDIGNIMLIFGFLAIGITTILNVSWYGGGKKMLPMLLAAAIFLNFSLFFSEAIIDVGNLFATQFYTQINGGVPATAMSLKSLSVANEGISNKLMSQLGLATLYGNAVDPAMGKIILKAANPWYIGFMGIILFIVTAFVMFSLAFILIARFVMLIFLIILAPVGFAGLAVPQLRGKAAQWWSTLLHQTFIAPILLLVLYVALAVITDAKFLIPGSATGFVENSNLAAFANYLVSFMIAIGLMFAVTISAKKLGAVGAGGAMKMASKISGAGLVMATPGWIGRNTIGSGGKYAAKKLRNTGFGRTFVGRGIAGTLEKKVAGASFDVRNTGLVKSVGGLELGAGHKGGYNEAHEAKVKSYGTAVAGITGSRKETQEEMKAKAKAQTESINAAKVHADAKGEYERHKKEVERLEEEKKKDSYFTASGREKEIDVARENLAASQKKFDSTKTEADKAETAASTVNENVKTATSETARKKEYQKRLEEVWGKIPLVGTAAAETVKKHGKEEKEKATFEGMFKKMVKEQAEADAKAKTAAAPAPEPSGGHH